MDACPFFNLPVVLARGGGCKPYGHRGQRCLTDGKNRTVGQLAKAIREDSISANNDPVSPGSAHCENLIWVRDPEYLRTAGDGNPLAGGYYLDKCLAGSTCPSADPADDLEPGRRLDCLPRVLPSGPSARLGKALPATSGLPVSARAAAWFPTQGSEGRQW